jgi:hypothetical protein
MGADVLQAVQCLMSLAVGDNPPVTDFDRPPIAGEIHQGEKDPNIYLSAPLHNIETQRRLIELLPGRDTDPITINLFAVDRSTIQPYEALSYVCGSRDADITILVNRKPFLISANLAQALYCLRLTESKRVLWVDALCINQADDIEMSYQVASIGEVYQNAVNVVIFLGEESDDSDLIMRYLDLDDTEEQMQNQSSMLDTISNGSTVRITAENRHVVELRIQNGGFNKAHLLRAADAFFKRPWWSRMWVFQEYHLAKREPQLYCGRHWVSAAGMYEKLATLHEYLIEEALPVEDSWKMPRVR